MNLKHYFLLLIFFFSLVLLPNNAYASETCTESVDCQESINENTYNIQSSLEDLNTYLSVDSESPIVIMDKESFNDLVSEYLLVWGLGFGLLLFGVSFSLGHWVFKR